MEIQQKSEFNDAIGLLTRCDAIFKGLIEYKQVQDAFNWYMLLFNLLMELSADMKEEAFKEIFDRLEKLNSDINRWQKQEATGNRQIDSTLFHNLILIEKDLKDVYAKCGYRSKVQDDASKALK